MIPVPPDPAASAEGAVDGAGKTDGETANSTRKGPSMVGLHDDMNMIVLD